MRFCLLTFFLSTLAFGSQTSISGQYCFLAMMAASGQADYENVIPHSYREILNSLGDSHFSPRILKEMIQSEDPFKLPPSVAGTSATLPNALLEMKGFLVEKFGDIRPYELLLLQELRKMADSTQSTQETQDKQLHLNAIAFKKVKWPTKVLGAVLSPNGKMMVAPYKNKRGGDQIIMSWDRRSDEFDYPNVMGWSKRMPVFSPKGDRVYSAIGEFGGHLEMNKVIGPPYELSSTTHQMGRFDGWQDLAEKFAAKGDKIASAKTLVNARDLKINPDGSSVTGLIWKNLLVYYRIRGERGFLTPLFNFTGEKTPISDYGYLDKNRIAVIQGKKLSVLNTDKKEIELEIPLSGEKAYSHIRPATNGKSVFMFNPNTAQVEHWDLESQKKLDTFNQSSLANLKPGEKFLGIEMGEDYVVVNTYRSADKTTVLHFFSTTTGKNIEMVTEIAKPLPRMSLATKANQLALTDSNQTTYLWDLKPILAALQ